MAINKIAGVMLEDDLLRDGSNLAIETDLLYIDVTNGFVGVKTILPETELDVIGTLKINDLTITSNVITNRAPTGLTIELATNDLDVTGSGILNLKYPVNQSDAATKQYVDNTIGGSSTDRISFGNSELIIFENLSNTSLTLTRDSGTTQILDVTETQASFEVPITSLADLSLTTLINNNISLNVSGTGIVSIYGTSALTIPVGLSSERPNPPELGAMRFNTDLDLAELYDGIKWASMTGQLVTFLYQSIIPDGLSVTYILNREATSESILVSFNGVLQNPDEAYTVLGTAITFLSAPLVSDIISIRFLTEVIEVYAIADALGTTKVQAVNGEVKMDVAGVNTITLNDNIILSPTAPNGNVLINSTTGLLLPTGTTLERPVTAFEGMIRYNTTTGLIEIFNGSNWGNSAGNILPDIISNSTGSTQVQTTSLDEVTIDVANTRKLTITSGTIITTVNIEPAVASTVDLGSISNPFNTIHVDIISGGTF